MTGKIAVIAASIGLCLGLAACGETQGERGLSGAAIGAGAGAVIGAVTPVGPAGGALIGGAVGGATGVLTTPSQVNLGRPVYRGGAGGGNAASIPECSKKPGSPSPKLSNRVGSERPSYGSSARASNGISRNAQMRPTAAAGSTTSVS